MSNLLSDLTWVEAGEVIREGCTVMVPIGSNEQHGPHMPIDCDSFYVTQVSEQVIDMLRDEMPIYRTPTIWTGYSPHHKSFPGTITLELDTFLSLIYDVCASLIRHNVRRIVLINGHGGNGAPLRSIGSKIGDHLGNSPFVFSYWEVLNEEKESMNVVQEGPSGIPGHAGELETSFRMHLSPETIRQKELEQAEFITSDPNPHSSSIYQYAKSEDFTPKGYTGHPQWAKAETGQAVMVRIIDLISGILRDDYRNWKAQT